jgi:hypothetical protein
MIHGCSVLCSLISPPHTSTHLLKTIKIYNLLTHSVRVVRTSESMALAKTTDPSWPRQGMRRVLLLPGIGHLATTTILPLTTSVELEGEVEESVGEVVVLVVVAMVEWSVESVESVVLCAQWRMENE